MKLFYLAFFILIAHAKNDAHIPGYKEGKFFGGTVDNLNLLASVWGANNKDIRTMGNKLLTQKQQDDASIDLPNVNDQEAFLKNLDNIKSAQKQIKKEDISEIQLEKEDEDPSQMDAILSILKAFEDKMQNTLKLGRYSHNDSKFLILLKITGNLYYQLTLDSIDTFFVSKPINRKIHILLGWDIHETHKAELEELVAPTKPAGSKAPSVSFGFPKQFNEQFEPAPFDEFPNSRVNRQVQLSPYQEKIPVKENLGIDSPESSNSGGTSQGLMSAFAGGNVGTVTSAFFSSPTIKSLIDAGSNTPFAAAFGQAAQPAMGLIQSYTAFGNGGKTMPSNQNSMLSLLEKSERSDMITLNYDRNSASSSYNSRDTSMNTRYQASLSVRETKNESSEKEMFYSQPSDIASSTPQTILSQDENMNDTAALDEATMHLNEELPFDSFISGYEKRITSDKDGKIARKYKTTIDKLGLSLKLVKEKNIIVIYRNINSRISYLLCHDEKGKLKILDEKTGSVISLAIKVNKNNGRAEFTDAKGNPINWNPFATTK